MSQGKLLGRIRKLTDAIQGIRAKFALPKADQERFDTYGGALALQKAKEDRRVLQGQLDPFRVVATGVSCRDCRHFAELDEPHCWADGYWPIPTKEARRNGGRCGPTAKLFAAAGLNA